MVKTGQQVAAALLKFSPKQGGRLGMHGKRYRPAVLHYWF